MAKKQNGKGNGEVLAIDVKPSGSYTHTTCGDSVELQDGWFAMSAVFCPSCRVNDDPKRFVPTEG